MTTTASMGHQAKLGIKKEAAYGSAETVNTGLNFVSESLKKTGVILEREAIRGFRDRVADDTRSGPYTVAGQLVLEPTPEDLVVLLPWILGANASGTSFALAETNQSCTVAVDRVAKVFTYAGCVVSRATFSGAQGGLMRLVLDLVGKSEAVADAGSFPALANSVTTPYIFNGDLTLTLAGAAKKCKNFELVIDNAVIADRFYNDPTIVNAPPGDRVITLRTEHAFSAGTGTTGNTDLYGLALAGVSGSLALATGGGYSTTFTFGVLQVPDHSPVVPSKAEIMLTLEMVARRTGSTPSLAVTHDSTPA